MIGCPILRLFSGEGRDATKYGRLILAMSLFLSLGWNTKFPAFPVKWH
jgi:hypothetical protein